MTPEEASAIFDAKGESSDSLHINVILKGESLKNWRALQKAYPNSTYTLLARGAINLAAAVLLAKEGTK